MKIAIVKCSFLLLLLIPFFSYAGNKNSEVEKKVNRQFAIQTDGYLEIDNKYGRIDIAIGERNQIKVEVTIKAKAGSEKKAQERLDMITVRFEEGNNRVSAMTSVESTSGWTSWFQTGNVEIEVNYQVFVPADIYLKLKNKYGAIYVETTDRDLQIDLSYGDVRLGDINGKLLLKMAYSGGALSKIKDGNLDLSYSDLDMEDASSVDVDMKYSDLTMGSATRTRVVAAFSNFRGMDIDDLHYRGKYDDVVVERVKRIDTESAYSGMKVSGVSESGRFEMRYGELQVNNITAGFSRIDVNTSYVGVVLRFASNASFAVDAQTNYCGIHHQGFQVKEDIEKAGSKTLKATKGAGGGLLYARMNYGSLRIE
jgi:hypothetical protein